MTTETFCLCLLLGVISVSNSLLLDEGCPNDCQDYMCDALGCLMCKKPYCTHFKGGNNSCVTTCPVGFACEHGDISNDCIRCVDNCDECNAKDSYCTKCKKGYTLNSYGFCH